jgi:uncharacterized protein
MHFFEALAAVPFGADQVLLWLALGAAAGFLGGLIGIGGGFVLVPGLYYMFSRYAGVQPQDAMPLALGTTMACIIFTATGSVLAHLRRGAVQTQVVRQFAPFVAPGTAVGALLATIVHTVFVKAGFALFCLYSATRMLFFSKTLAKEGASMSNSRVPLAGSFFGTLCGLLGVGGANLFVPYMMKRNIDIRQAMATASALQLPVAVTGTVAFILLGQHHSLPLGSLGFVYTPALAILVTASMVLAPVGVWATHALPVGIVRKIFACFTALVGLKMAGVPLL